MNPHDWLWSAALGAIVTACTASPASLTATTPTNPNPRSEAASLPPAPDATPSAARPSTGALDGPVDASSGNQAPQAWTDPSVIAKLAEDCRYAPKPPDTGYAESSPWLCGAGLYHQSCVPDPCFSVDQESCEPKCQKSCEACAATCTTGCEGCKSHCTDDGCRHACAERCGACRQGCMQEQDHCSTGVCAQQYEACRKKRHAEWMASACPRLCDTYKACVNHCPVDPASSSSFDEACRKACARPLSAGCKSEFATACMMDGELSAIP